jgi:putative FmdB family regulatory protein
MPLYEYVCKQCGQQFEELIRGQEQPVCPHCGSRKVEKQLSKVAAHSTESGRASPEGRLPCGLPPGCCSGQCGLT